MNNMEIKVSNVQFVTVGEDQRVHVHFRGQDADNQININGYVPATMDEYLVDPSLSGLSNLVRTKVSERLGSA